MSFTRGTARHISSLWSSLCRLKTQPGSVVISSSASAENTGTFEYILDLCCSGLGSSLTLGALVVTGIATGHIAGGSATLAVLLAAIVAGLNG